jgi:hypothetical protein
MRSHRIDSNLRVQVGEEITSGAVATNDLAGCRYLERRCWKRNSTSPTSSCFASETMKFNLGTPPIADEMIAWRSRLLRNDSYATSKCERLLCPRATASVMTFSVNSAF